MQAQTMEDRENLLSFEEETKEGRSLQEVTREALREPIVREMLAAFREEGPSALTRFVGDPRCDAALRELRGPARQFRPRVLLGVTGSIAAVKVPELLGLMSNFDVKVIATERGAHFHPALCDEWTHQGIMHIELKKWADVFVIAPLSANSLAKLANGLADNLVTCVARAWDFRKPMVLAPAMNTAMWEHPATAPHIALLQQWGAIIVPPVVKTLACGDTGMGGLASPATIVAAVQRVVL